MNLEEIEQYIHSHSPREILENALNQFFYTSNENYDDLIDKFNKEVYNEVTENIQYLHDSITDIKINWPKYKWLIEILGDEKSKDTVIKMIAAKLTMKTKYIEEAYSNETIYFNEKIFGQLTQEIYVDCGAYTGDSVLKFIQTCPQYCQIYAFEAMPEATKLCLENISSFPNTKIYELAVSDSNKVLYFDSQTLSGDSKENERGTTKVLADSLDNLIKEPLSFIKMDIEGGEKAAIEGAQSLILEYHPKMAICIYHLSDDFWKIPELILSINPEYDFFIRQHDPEVYSETILYCVPRRNRLNNNCDMSSEDTLRNLMNVKSKLFFYSYEENANLHQHVLDKKWFLQQLRQQKLKCEKIEEDFNHTAWIEELQKAKSWLEDQWEQEKSQRIILEKKILELKDWIEKIQSDKEWINERWIAEKQSNEEINNQVVELKSWADELTSGKVWIEEQWFKEKQEKDKILEVLKLREDEISQMQIEISKYKYKLGLLVNDEKVQKIIKKKKYEI